MKCPRTFFATDDGKGGLKIAGAECIKEGCPWWNKTMQECNFVTIAVELHNLYNVLQEIREKIPSQPFVK